MARKSRGRGGAIVGARSKAAGRIDSVIGRQKPRQIAYKGSTRKS